MNSPGQVETASQMTHQRYPGVSGVVYLEVWNGAPDLVTWRAGSLMMHVPMLTNPIDSGHERWACWAGERAAFLRALRHAAFRLVSLEGSCTGRFHACGGRVIHCNLQPVNPSSYMEQEHCLETARRFKQARAVDPEEEAYIFSACPCHDDTTSAFYHHTVTACQPFSGKGHYCLFKHQRACTPYSTPLSTPFTVQKSHKNVASTANGAQHHSNNSPQNYVTEERLHQQ